MNPQVPPSANPLNFSLLSAQPQPNPQQKTDRCKCEKPKEKKEKKERQPRAKCYEGKFKQRAFGISYSRGSEIPCEAAPKVSGKTKLTGLKKRAAGAVKKALKRKKAPKLGDLARDVLGF